MRASSQHPLAARIKGHVLSPRDGGGPLSRLQHPSVRSPPPTHVISVARDEAALLALPHAGLSEVSVRLSSGQGPLNSQKIKRIKKEEDGELH